MGTFEVADHEIAIRFWNGGSHMAAGNLIILYSDEKLEKGIILVADYEYAFGSQTFRKHKMADSIIL